MTNELQEMQRRIRELTEQNAFLTGIIDRAMTKFCEDGSDGAIAAEMFRIVSNRERPNHENTKRPSAGSADSELNRNNEMNEPDETPTADSRRLPAAPCSARITAAETSIAQDLFRRMWAKIRNPDGTADGNRIVGIISTMLATAAITVRDESMMSETIDDIAAQAKAWADRAPQVWEKPNA